jgi:hypothetical protein
MESAREEAERIEKDYYNNKRLNIEASSHFVLLRQCIEVEHKEEVIGWVADFIAEQVGEDRELIIELARIRAKEVNESIRRYFEKES